MYTCVNLSHFAVQWRLAQHYKSTVVQLKKKKAKPFHQRHRASLGRQCDPPPCSLAAGGEGAGGMEVVGTNSQPDPECEMCLCRGIWNLPRLF